MKKYCPVCGEELSTTVGFVAGESVTVVKCECGYVCSDGSKIG